ncbi:MAG TPA: MaoC family dehydratase [Thiolinea sp.]|nr:MaoC family dehydratase [Thiolinea sp.]
MSETRELKVGDKVSITRTFSEQDVRDYARLSMDTNPVHLDAAYAAATQFRERIVHGMFVGSLFTAMLGTQLPGEGSIYVSQSLKFKLPVHLDEAVTGTVEITDIRTDKPFVTLKTTVVNAEGKNVVEGEAVIYVPWLKR